jgi:protein TonB
MAITHAAPRTDRRLAFLGAMAIWGCMPLAMIAVEGLMPHSPLTPPAERTKQETIYDFQLGSFGPAAPSAPTAAPPSLGLQALAVPRAVPSVPRASDDANVEMPNALPAGAQGSSSVNPSLSSGTTPGVVGNPVGTATSTIGGTSQGPVDVTATGLQILKQVEPAYPPVARAARIQGNVVLRMLVDERGLPIHADVVEGPALLRAEALRAAQQWEFSPARVSGQSVKATFLLTIKFRLI